MNFQKKNIWCKDCRLEDAVLRFLMDDELTLSCNIFIKLAKERFDDSTISVAVPRISEDFDQMLEDEEFYDTSLIC